MKGGISGEGGMQRGNTKPEVTESHLEGLGRFGRVNGAETRRIP